MGSSNSGGKSKKCQQCRIRKIKCDLKLPRCSQCEGLGKNCSGPVSGNIFIIMDGQKKGKNIKPDQEQDIQALLPNMSSSVQQPNLPLVQAVGLRNYDPFSTYPVLPYPSEGVDRLVSFYLRIVGPKIISVNPRGTWFRSALTDPVLFQSTLYSAALHFNSLWKAGDSQLAVFHRIQLLGMINERLRDPSQSLSDQTLAAVALIVYTEIWPPKVINGPITEYSTHMAGLRQMMNMRGSLGKSSLLGLLQRMVASSTVFAAIRMNCVAPDPPGPMGSPDEIDVATTCNSASMGRSANLLPPTSSSIILGRLRQYRFHPNFLTVLDDLYQIVSLFHRESCQIAAELHQADLDSKLFYTEHRLVQCQSVEVSADNHVQRSLCVACLIFISLFLREIPVPVLLNEALTSRLRETMGGIDQTSWIEAPPEVMLWMLFMGGIVATGRRERPWFVSHLSRLEMSPDFQDWDSMKASLQSVLWVYKVLEEPCKALCAEVITLKTSGDPFTA